MAIAGHIHRPQKPVSNYKIKIKSRLVAMTTGSCRPPSLTLFYLPHLMRDRQVDEREFFVAGSEIAC